MSPRALRILLGTAVLACSLSTARAADSELSESLRAVATTDGTAKLDRAAAAAAKAIQSLPSSRVTEVLAGFPAASPRGKNWLRSLAADVSDNGPFPASELRGFFDDRTHDPDARYVAFQLLTQQDPERRQELLDDAATDPSLPIRYLKIRSMIDRSSSLLDEQPDKAEALLRDVVAHGRSPGQLEKATKMLADLGVEIDLADELGMMRRWWVVGPFDNTDSQNFDTVYAPEARYLQSELPYVVDADGAPRDDVGKPQPGAGQNRPAVWQQVRSEDSLGMVDLNAPLANEKDAAAYAFARFKVDGPAPAGAEMRLGCITANKVWINGKPATSNEVYHSGTRIDQYVAPCNLTAGENTVLIKVLQNAQTEPWAQDWQFQFRFTRPDGSAIKTIWVD